MYGVAELCEICGVDVLHDVLEETHDEEVEERGGLGGLGEGGPQEVVDVGPGLEEGQVLAVVQLPNTVLQHQGGGLAWGSGVKRAVCSLFSVQRSVYYKALPCSSLCSAGHSPRSPGMKGFGSGRWNSFISSGQTSFQASGTSLQL